MIFGQALHKETNMKTKLFTGLIIIALFICVALYYFEKEKTNSLSANILQLKKSNKTLTENVAETEKLYNKHSEELQKELSCLMKQITELEQCITEQSLSERSKKITENKEGKAVSDYMSGLARMMEHSTLRDSTRANIRAQAVNVVYGDFIKNNMIDKTESEKIIELLVDKSFARFGRNMEMLNPKLTCTQKKIIVKQIKKDRATIDKKIENLLNKEVFNEYLEIEKNAREILYVNRFNIKLSNESIQMLTKRQQKALVKLIYKERTYIESKSGFVTFEYACPDDLTDKNVRKFLNQEKNMDSAILKKSKIILAKDQFKAFSVFLKHTNEELKRKIKLLRSVRNKTSKFAIC